MSELPFLELLWLGTKVVGVGMILAAFVLTASAAMTYGVAKLAIHTASKKLDKVVDEIFDAEGVIKP